MYNFYKKVGPFYVSRHYFAFVGGNAMITYLVGVGRLTIRWDRKVPPAS